MFDAYKVAVKLTLVNHVSTGLAAIAAQMGPLNNQFLGGQQHLAGMKRELMEIKRLGLIGGALAGVGFGGLSLMKAPLEEAKKFQTEVAKFRSLGFGDAVSSQAEKFARGMKTVGVSAAENMSLVSDAMAVFKDLHHAEIAAPLMAKMKFANQAVFGAEKGAANESKFMDMLKVIEFRGGLSSDKEFATQADFVQKVIAGSRNRVDATQLLSALKTGGVALSRRSNEQFYLGSEPLIQEFGGQRYGTGAMSIYQNLVQARGTITAQQELYRLGLLQKDMVEFNQLGKLKKAKAGAFIGSKILEEEGELALLEKVLLPAFAKNGITDDESVIRELGVILGNRTGSGLMARIYQQRETIKKQSEANKNAMGINDLTAEGRKTFDGQMIIFHAEWKNLQLELGKTILPMAIEALKGLTSAVKSFNRMAQDNPGLVKTMTVAFVGLSAAMAFGGTVMLLSAAMKGLSLATSLAIGSQGAAGIAGIIGKVTNFGGAIGALANPIGIVVLALGTLAAAAYAFRPLTQKEVDAAKTDGGVKLTPDALRRARAMGWEPPTITPGSGPKSTFLTKERSDKASASMALAAKTQKPFWQDIASIFGLGGNQAQQAKSFAPPAESRPVQVSTQINLDGRRVAEVVTQHQAKDMTRPPSGPSAFDGSMNLRALGSGFAG